MKRKCIFCKSSLYKYLTHTPLECYSCKGPDSRSACMFLYDGAAGWFVIDRFALYINNVDRPEEISLFYFDINCDEYGFYKWKKIASIKDGTFNLNKITAKMVEKRIKIMRAFS